MREETTADERPESPFSPPDVRIDPADVLRLVRNARVELTVPLVEGTLLPGLSVRPGTVARVDFTVRDGVLDTDEARVEILPALDGPLFTSVQAVRIGSDCRATITLKGFPDVKLGPPLPARLTELADELDDGAFSRRMSVRVLGVKLGKVRLGDGSGMAAKLADGEAPGAPRFEGARITSLEAELGEGRIDLGDLGTVRLAEGSRLRARGTGKALTLDARFELEDFDLEHPSVSIETGSGSTGLAVTWEGDESGGGRISVRLHDFHLRARKLRAAWGDGDFAVLADPEIRSGFIEAGTAVSDGSFPMPTLASLQPRSRIEDVRGTIEEARITTPFGRSQTQLVLRDTGYRGAIEVAPDSFSFDGDATLAATVRGFVSDDEALPLEVEEAEMSGPGKVHFSWKEGLRIREGRLPSRAVLRSLLLRGRSGAPLARIESGTTAEFLARELDIRHDGRLRLQGSAAALVLRGFAHRSESLSAQAEAVHVTYTGETTLDSDEGIRLRGGALKIQATGGEASLRTAGHELQLAGRALFEAEVDSARADPDGPDLHCLNSAKFSAEAERGKVAFRDGGAVPLRAGSTLRGRLDGFRVGTREALQAAGTARIHLRVDASDKLADLMRDLGLRIDSVAGAEARSVDVEIGRFEAGPDRRYRASDVRIGVDARIRGITGGTH